MSRPTLKLVRQSDPPTKAEDEPCGGCAFVVIFIVMGLFWWPIFTWFYWERLYP